MYIETPVGPAERARLVADLQDALRRPRHRELALRAVQDVVLADGVLTDGEQNVVAEIQAAIESAEVGLLAGLQRLVGTAVQRRSAVVANTPNREDFFQDFIKNKVYYAVSQRLKLDGSVLEIPEKELRTLSLAGGLMAKIAHIDRQVTESEFNAIVEALQTHWRIDIKEATLVAEVAVSAVHVTYDTHRMMREMATSATVEERRRYLVALFAVAAADGKLSIEEHEEIRIIARGLNLSHKEFIRAKLTALGEEPINSVSK
jgi:uncharacterized tellurite resistance protein B-like protein